MSCQWLFIPVLSDDGWQRSGQGGGGGGGA